MSLHFARFKYGSNTVLGSLPTQYDNRDFVPQRPQGLAQPTGDNTSLKHGAFPFSAVFRDAHCPSSVPCGQCAFMQTNLGETDVVPAIVGSKSTVGRVLANNRYPAHALSFTVRPRELALPASVAIAPSTEGS